MELVLTETVAPEAPSKTFCVLPWIHMNVWPDGNVYPCCMADNAKPVGSVRQSKLDFVWNSEGMRRMRLAMLSGKESPECAKCYEIERSGMPSLRRRVNAQFAHHVPRSQETAKDGRVERLSMAYFDIRFSNVCNFRCRTCCPDLSSAWHADAKALSGRDDLPSLIRASGDPESLWRQVDPLLEGAEEIYFAGGEPLVMEEHYRILDRLIELKLFHVRLCYNTNFSMLSFNGYDLPKAWAKFRTVRLGASLDGMGARGEYLRKGQRWPETERNRERLRQTCPSVEFHVTATLSAFNALHLADFHRVWMERGWLRAEDFYLNLLLDPPEYRAQVLPLALRQSAADSFRRHVEALRPRWRSDAPPGEGWLAAADFLLAEDKSHLLPQLRLRTARLDAVRKEDCASVFPELAGVLRP